MNRLPDHIDVALEVANQEYERLKIHGTQRVTIKMIAKRHALSAQQLKDWRERNVTKGKSRKPPKR